MGTGENAGGNPCDGLVSHPGKSRNTPSRFMLWKPEISPGLTGLPRLVPETSPLFFFFYVQHDSFGSFNH